MCITFDTINRKLSISEMAQIHDISRQTLIYYDKIGLFRPAITDETNGYRYYSTLQIPLLREICFLRSIGMPLEDIRKHNEYNASTSTIELLESQREKINIQMSRLREQLHQIEKRVRVYQDAGSYEDAEYRPVITYFPDRWVIYREWDSDDLTRYGMHYTLMKIWNEAEKHGLLPSRRWGALIMKKDLENHTPLRHAGGCCEINVNDRGLPGLHHLEAGEYVCMPKYGMSYDTTDVCRLAEWISSHGYEIVGDIYDECLLDTIFYDDDYELDFCELQVPICTKAV